MFTGIIESLGTLISLEPLGGDFRLTLGQAKNIDWAQVQLGDSIATNGVCLTVTQKHPQGFSADVSRETLSLTTVGEWSIGQPLNLEQALTPQKRLGGHIVSGHVDGVGEVIQRSSDARSERFKIRAPQTLARYLAHKGSVCVDGVSLTINAIEGAVFDLNIVPHTLKHTVINAYKVGTRVNLEVDVMARYLERLLLGDAASQPHAASITTQFLADHGY